MPDIDLRVMKRTLAEQSVPVESAKLTLRAVRADGPFTSVGGSDITTSPTSTVPFRDGAATDRIFLPPTDGTYGWEFELLVDGALILSEVRGIPASDAAVPYGALPKLDRSTLQPTDDVVAAWESTAAEAEDARNASVAAAGAAEGHARDAADSAGDAAGSAGSAESSAGDAAGSAGSAAGSAGDAAGFAGAASESAGQASGAAGRAGDSASAAAESERKAGLSAGAAATSAGTADTKAGEAATSAGQAGQAKTAAETARDVALAGQFAGSPLGNADLNTIETPGVYRQGSSASLASNYPVALLGALIVYPTAGPASGRWLTQEYHPVDNNTARVGRVYYRRVKFDATWGPWRVHSSQRVNKPAGQPGSEYFTWNDATNAEQQLMPVNTPLGTANLDTVLTDGTYYQDNGANATTANSYPAVATNTAGILRVSRRNHDNWIVQEWNPLSFTATQQSITLIRRRINSTWQAWQIVPTSLTDSSVGRRQFLFDEVNGRLNMVYGDTGVRDVTALATTDWTPGTMYLRRCGYQVELVGNMNSVGGATVAPNTILFNVPVGYRPAATINKLMAGGSVVHGVIVGTDGTLRADSGLTALRWGLTWMTANSWPTSLPGTAFGVIPVN